MSRKILALALFVVVLAGPALFARAIADEPSPARSDDELRAEVPALNAFHEVIYPLWHEAWPNQDLDLMRELLPQLKEHVAAIRKAELPGILRDRQLKWNEGVDGVASSVAWLDTALAQNDRQAALQAAEALHAGYEHLRRTIRPLMKELDAFHQVLYTIYHYNWPQGELPALRANVAELAARCEALATTPIPKRFAAQEEQLRKAFAAMCAATSALRTAAANGDAKQLGAAVTEVHARFQECEKLFD